MAKQKLQTQKDFRYKSSVIVLISLFLVLGFALTFMTQKNLTGHFTLNNGVCEFDETNPDGNGVPADCVGTSSGGQGSQTLSSMIGGIFSGASFNFGGLGGFFGTLNNILMGKGLDNYESYMRWSFFILLSAFFFSVISVLDFFKKDNGKKNVFLIWLVAIPLAFLSIALITQDNAFMTSIQTYGALGLTFISVIPLAVIILFASQLLQNPTGLKVILQLMILYYFLAYQISILFNIPIQNPSVWVIGIQIGAIIALILLIVFNRRYRVWVADLGRDIQHEVARDTAAASQAIRTAGPSSGIR